MVVKDLLLKGQSTFYRFITIDFQLWLSCISALPMVSVHIRWSICHNLAYGASGFVWRYTFFTNSVLCTKMAAVCQICTTCTCDVTWFQKTRQLVQGEQDTVLLIDICHICVSSKTSNIFLLHLYSGWLYLHRHVHTWKLSIVCGVHFRDYCYIAWGIFIHLYD